MTERLRIPDRGLMPAIAHRRPLHHLLILLVALATSASAWSQQKDLIPPTEAYQYVVVDTGEALEIDWAIEDGYYLYKNKLSFESGTDGVRLADYTLPEGLHHEDEFFGVQQVYRDRFFVTIPYDADSPRPDSATLVIRSQGCADIGICFPPQTWNANVELISAAASEANNAFALSSPFGNASGLGDFLPVDEAFHPYLLVIDGNTVELSWQVAPGYYLYKDKISAS
ncbi:MAG: protein-disulfide reductase DsbD family protein, partial [Woeseia sp.]